jgi:hypothetical protein
VKINLKIFVCILAVFNCFYAFGQIEKAKSEMKSCAANSQEALNETENALHFLDSAAKVDIDMKSKERFIKLAESEIISSKRMIIFSEDEAENAVKITDDACIEASEIIAPIFIETNLIIIKLEEAAIQLNLWLQEKELREAIDFTGTAQINLKDATAKFILLKETIEKAKLKVEACP